MQTWTKSQPAPRLFFASEVCVTNGAGVSGNPTLGICSGFLSTAHS